MRLIDANELLDRFSMDDRDQFHVIQIGDVIDAIEGTPTVDPVKHGHWEAINKDSEGYADAFECSVCHQITCCPCIIDNFYYKYCPFCGARNEVVK